jgi:hypothetical protein
VNQIETQSESLEPLTEEKLRSLREPVLEIIGQRLEHGWDTPYDHFLYDLVGDPYYNTDKEGRPLFPKIEQQYDDGEVVVYDQPLVNSYREDDGTLVHVRTTSHRPSIPERNYYVVTDNLYKPARQVWEISDIKLPRPAYKVPAQEVTLFLDDPEVDKPAPSLMVSAPGLVLRLMQERRTARRDRKVETDKNYIRLSSEGNELRWQGEEAEIIAPLNSVERELRRYGAQIMAMLEHETAADALSILHNLAA